MPGLHAVPPCFFTGTRTVPCTERFWVPFYWVYKEADFQVDHRWVRYSPYNIYYNNRSRVGPYRSGVGPIHNFDCSTL